MRFLCKCLVGLPFVSVLTGCGTSSETAIDLELTPTTVRISEPDNMTQIVELAADVRLLVWTAAVQENAEVAWRRAARRSSTPATPATPTTQIGEPAVAYAPGDRCGGDLPPCWVKARESGGNYSAVNPTGCGGHSCGGAWQFDPRTWNGYGGYQYAQDAPPDVQDARARELWAGGAGCSHWSACG